MKMTDASTNVMSYTVLFPSHILFNFNNNYWCEVVQSYFVNCMIIGHMLYVSHSYIDVTLKIFLFNIVFRTCMHINPQRVTNASHQNVQNKKTRKMVKNEGNIVHKEAHAPPTHFYLLYMVMYSCCLSFMFLFLQEFYSCQLFS